MRDTCRYLGVRHIPNTLAVAIRELVSGHVKRRVEVGLMAGLEAVTLRS